MTVGLHYNAIAQILWGLGLPVVYLKKKKAKKKMMARVLFVHAILYMTCSVCAGAACMRHALARPDSHEVWKFYNIIQVDVHALTARL